MQQTLEYWLVVAVARILGWMPRWLARLLAGALAWAVYRVMGRLRRVGERNLSLALPELTAEARRDLLRSRLSPPGLAAGRVLPDAPLHAREYEATYSH